MTETTKETRYKLLNATRPATTIPSGVCEVTRLELRLCVADAERLAELERIAETDTDDSFLECDDEMKKLMLALYIEDGKRLKWVLDRLNEIKAALRLRIVSEESAAMGYSEMGDVAMAALCQENARCLQRILDGGEQGG